MSSQTSIHAHHHSERNDSGTEHQITEVFSAERNGLN